MKKYLLISCLSIQAMVFLPSKVQAQGENLFKAKCNTCHLLDKNSTGPMLKGVKQKWTDAGEAEMLYQWVQNSAGLISGGKSKMADAIKGFSATEMPPQTVSNEEIDAILDFIDNPPVTPPPTTGNVEVETTYIPDYKANLDIFYGLMIAAFVLLLAILIVSNSIITLVKSDYFTTRLKEKSNNGGLTGLIILILAGSLLVPDQALALSYTAPGTTTEPTLWLLVENSDLYLMLIIDLILLSVLLYLRRMFRNFAQMVKTPREQAAEQGAPTLRKINQILTDVVPIEQEEKIMLHHEYDGIRELDNNLPPWWVWGFVATVVFAIVYIFNYHVFNTSDLQIAAYEKEMDQAKIEVQEYLSKMAMNVDENTATLLTEAADVNAGKVLFQTHCVSCHNEKGEGNIGPNLTDKSWIYGFDIKEVFKTVKNGTSNGMPEHTSKLNPVQIQQVASFVLQLPEKEGKKAEGTFIEK